MAIKTTNLGLVKAIFVGTSAPSNKNLIWRDTSLTVPIHKFYNETTLSWVELVNAVLVDNITIKIDVDGKLYVDSSEIPSLTVENGSITLIKMADMPTSSLIYRKTAGTGVPEVNLLATLKVDLLLEGTNTGDQDLSLLALKSYTINGHQLNGNIEITPEDIGSPSGSGSSSGANTGDETLISILYKLGIPDIYSATHIDETFQPLVIGKGLSTEDFTTEDKEKLDALAKPVYWFSLISSSTVAGRCAGTITRGEGTELWNIVAGSSDVDLSITHDTFRKPISVTITSTDINGDRILTPFLKAYSGVISPDDTHITIEGLATIETVITVFITFK